MAALHYKKQDLFLEDVALRDISSAYGTPCYVYSASTLIANLRAYYNALKQTEHPFKIHYAVKANSNLHILRLLAENGAGFDVVSGGEILRVLKAGARPEDIVFSGVGKTQAEIAMSLDLGIFAIHVESVAELFRINELAATKDVQANISFRINPNVCTNTHAYTATGTNDKKFGIEYAKALDIYLLAQTLSNIKICGIACHIGSQIMSLDPFLQATKQILALVEQLEDHGIHLEYIDIGGGLGITYQDETPPSAQEYVQAIVNELKHSKLALHIEPGRSIIGNAGVLLTKVEYLKTTGTSHFAIVDAAMNDLIRPALYQSYHDIVAARIHNIPAQKYAVVGPVCESGDFLGLERTLQITEQDLLVIKDCGAYGFSQSSNYNSRTRAPEILVNGNEARLIRRRETLEQLLENEIFANEYAPSC